MGARDHVRARPAPITKEVDVGEINGLVELSGRVVDPTEKLTQEMDPAMFRALLAKELEAPAAPAPIPVVETAPPAPSAIPVAEAEPPAASAPSAPVPVVEAAPPEPSGPIVVIEAEPPEKQPALIVEERVEKRRAAAIAPITKPPVDVTAAPATTTTRSTSTSSNLPDEPWIAQAMMARPVKTPRVQVSLPLIIALAIAIAVAVAFVLIN